MDEEFKKRVETISNVYLTQHVIRQVRQAHKEWLWGTAPVGLMTVVYSWLAWNDAWYWAAPPVLIIATWMALWFRNGNRMIDAILAASEADDAYITLFGEEPPR